MPRLFMAVRVPPNDNLRRVLGRFQDVRGVKPVEPENLHFTLRFLGDVSDTVRAALVKVLANATVSRRPFPVHVHGTSAFPKPVRPSVVWAGVDEGADGLKALAKEVDHLALELGLGDRDKPFVPHLTLARVKDKGGRGQEQAARVVREEAEVDHGTFTVDRWVLVHSMLTPAGPEYEDIAEVPLR
ncbi:MAG: RNA 2',3'-cyclic phosphodiesterase [Euryarchaeota archaeon]|nr:RNA 2',3'-cyclic phosphodiesterase [Euryarchaeota archaeon]